ncbi:hypothetical protein EDD68_101297 [Melghiribacillus thermohalophilus]|uniref:Uncharacterized protein n=1 Tax=Melghiribacillus thermohalophilus TaxID=1324956 RepID=A0A4R3NDF1_9BACI|nr:SA1362 family protein [Melghiribacillus thermohalophilus]TCT26940.1 hypothetical protein EDD68_101297 [Melghiribacillus thermohalophilus]
MFLRKLPLLIVLLISLALFGFVYQLIFHTAELLTYLIMAVGVAAVIFALLYALVIKPRTRPLSSKYKKAVRQSRKKYGSNIRKSKSMKNKHRSRPFNRHRSNPPHLKVIDGKRNKKKNRASF